MKKICSLAFLLTLAMIASSSFAQQNPFVGTWIATTAEATTTFVMEANSHYSAKHVSGPYTTFDSGSYVINGDFISFNVEDWAPKTQPIYQPQGTTGGSYVQQPTSKPSGAIYQFHFLSGDSIMFIEINSHDQTIIKRVQ